MSENSTYKGTFEQPLLVKRIIGLLKFHSSFVLKGPVYWRDLSNKLKTQGCKEPLTEIDLICFMTPNDYKKKSLANSYY